MKPKTIKCKFLPHTHRTCDLQSRYAVTEKKYMQFQLDFKGCIHHNLSLSGTMKYLYFSLKAKCLGLIHQQIQIKMLSLGSNIQKHNT